MIRNPAVAGSFHPAQPATLRNDLLELTEGRTPPASPRGLALMVPHAAYIYPGSVIDLTLAEAIGECGGDVLVVISSDMSHYVSAEVAERDDRKAIDRILALDPEGLHRVVIAERIGMCGSAPAVAVLAAVRELGAKAARLIAYATSADRTGDRGSVIGYAGVAVT